jgi:hypothetical protein
MIFTKHDYFERVFYCSFSGYKVGIISDEQWERMSADKKDDYIMYSVKFKPLTWGQHGKLRGSCQTTCPETGQRIFNYDMYAVKKLSMVIVEWNLTRKDEEGNIENIDPTEKAVEMLHPLIATHMLSVYEDEVEMSKETEKN